MKRNASRGFTLTEMMIAVVISVMVFGAMATLLSRCFSLWLEAQAQWKLAQHARVARVRILNGAFGTGTGLLSASNVTVNVNSGGGWQTISFEPVGAATPGTYKIYGWVGNNPKIIFIQSPSSDLAWGQAVGNNSSGSDMPTVLANDFDIGLTNQTIRISYTLRFKAIGRDFELPQVLEARLVNNDG